ncbi:MAG: hypothetical protein KDK60_00710, partial [Chlamydiia bacterium]|nr:hypothetical protein [Chlamydiia bacterium]
APDAILQLGDRFVSQKLYDWIASKRPKVHCQVSNHPLRRDPIHSITHRIVSELPSFITSLTRALPGRPHSEWLKAWKELNHLVETGTAAYFKMHPALTEPALFHHLKEAVPPSFGIYFGNSLSIRNADAFFAPKNPVGPLFGNRGLSGIDGNIATIAGLASGIGKGIVGVIGDLTFLHDLNSLPLIRDLPVKLVVINNNGGDIFSFLPIMSHSEVFKPFFLTPHNSDLKHAGKLFGIPYDQVETYEMLDDCLSQDRGGIIEVKTRHGESLDIHRDLLSNLKVIQSHVTELTTG